MLKGLSMIFLVAFGLRDRGKRSRTGAPLMPPHSNTRRCGERAARRVLRRARRDADGPRKNVDRRDRGKRSRTGAPLMPPHSNPRRCGERAARRVLRRARRDADGP
ncbi:hypothetical protein, partial [Burkholderia pseudomallei]|uniref:hypothetical protein n=1 Tax=Burkholderia pseudomallei TaxID=28450 RepID=UPI001C836D68